MVNTLVIIPKRRKAGIQVTRVLVLREQRVMEQVIVGSGCVLTPAPPITILLIHDQVAH